MKKIGVLLTVLLLALTSFSYAQDSSNPDSSDSENQNSQDSPSTIDSSLEKINKGFQCLEKSVGDCTSLSTQELATTILATPDNVFDKCVAELKSRGTSGDFGNIKDTALSILALKHAGQETKEYEDYILSQERSPKELIWYLEQDSDSEAECRIGYDSKEYVVSIGENKKINKDAGSCLKRSSSGFWFEVSPECYGIEFTIGCDQKFITAFLYKDKSAPTLYVLEGTEGAPASNEIKLKVNSKCFGSSSCEYEATLWATLALLKTGHTIENYLPYIIALSESNKRYLPESFVYTMTNLEDYATQLSKKQSLGNYWQAENSAYNRYYDTALALLALGRSSSDQIKSARDYLLFNQGTDGCWQNDLDTAMVLWALTLKADKAPSGGSTVQCKEAGFFCISKSDCPTADDVGNNYFCSSISETVTCCKTENIKLCSAYSGSVCSSGEVCSGNERKASDTPSCCTGNCVPKPTLTECESSYYSCKSSCSSTEDQTSLTCNQGQVCCKPKPANTNSDGSGWIWFLVIAIIVVLAVILWVLRERIKLYWFSLRSGFKKDKGPSRSGPSYGNRPPSRPPLPPPRMPQSQGRPQPRKDDELDDTFSKLRNMSK